MALDTQFDRLESLDLQPIGLRMTVYRTRPFNLQDGIQQLQRINFSPDRGGFTYNGTMYTLQQRADNGVSGQIYLLSPPHNRLCVKVIPNIEPGTGDDYNASNLREAIIQHIVYTVSSQVQHTDAPYAPRIHGVFRSTDNRYTVMIMEKCDITLFDLIQNRRISDADGYKHVLLKVARKLQNLWRLYEFNHTDLHAKNVMRLQDRTWRLIDFGRSCISFGGFQRLLVPWLAGTRVSAGRDLTHLACYLCEQRPQAQGYEIIQNILVRTSTVQAKLEEYRRLTRDRVAHFGAAAFFDAGNTRDIANPETVLRAMNTGQPPITDALPAAQQPPQPPLNQGGIDIDFGFGGRAALQVPVQPQVPARQPPVPARQPPVPARQPVPVQQQVPLQQQVPVQQPVPAGPVYFSDLPQQQVPVQQPIQQAPIQQAPVQQPVQQAPEDLANAGIALIQEVRGGRRRRGSQPPPPPPQQQPALEQANQIVEWGRNNGFLRAALPVAGWALLRAVVAFEISTTRAGHRVHRNMLLRFGVYITRLAIMYIAPYEAVIPTLIPLITEGPLQRTNRTGQYLIQPAVTGGLGAAAVAGVQYAIDVAGYGDQMRFVVGGAGLGLGMLNYGVPVMDGFNMLGDALYLDAPAVRRDVDDNNPMQTFVMYIFFIYLMQMMFTRRSNRRIRGGAKTRKARKPKRRSTRRAP